MSVRIFPLLLLYMAGLACASNDIVMTISDISSGGSACEELNEALSLERELDARIVKPIFELLSSPRIPATYPGKRPESDPHALQNSDSPIDVVFLHSKWKETVTSMHWLAESILRGVRRPYAVSVHESSSLVGQNRTVVVTSESLTDLFDAIDEYSTSEDGPGERSHFSFGVVHLHQHSCHNIEWYNRAEFVIRNHPCTETQLEGIHVPVLPLPVGWEAPASVVPEGHFIPAIDRTYALAFLGGIDERRRVAVEQMKENIGSAPFYIYDIPSSYHPSQPSAYIMKNYLAQTLFVPCVSFHAADMSRTYEALESGAIPIIRRSVLWRNLYGKDHPLPIVRSWDEAAVIARTFWEDRSRAHELQERVLTWWVEYKQSMREELASYFDRL